MQGQKTDEVCLKEISLLIKQGREELNFSEDYLKNLEGQRQELKKSVEKRKLKEAKLRAERFRR